MAPNRPGHLRDDKFVISCAARTGSTMLVLLLSSHPEILCHIEPYQQESKVGWLAGRYAEMRRDNPEIEDRLWSYLVGAPVAFLYDVLFDRQDKRVVGFKYKTDEAFTTTWPNRADLQPIIAQDRDIKIIRLRRLDMLAQFISHQVVKRTGMTLLRGSSEAPRMEPFSVEPAVVVDYFRDVERRDTLASEAYREHRQFDVYYENLVDPAHPVRDQLLEFLGVRPAELSTPSRQIVTDGYRVLVNIDEIVQALATAGFASRISGDWSADTPATRSDG